MPYGCCKRREELERKPDDGRRKRRLNGDELLLIRRQSSAKTQISLTTSWAPATCNTRTSEIRELGDSDQDLPLISSSPNVKRDAHRSSTETTTCSVYS